MNGSIPTPTAAVTGVGRPEDPIRHALSVLCELGQTVEIRAIGRDGSVFSGYGQNIDEIARQVSALNISDITGIYFTLNPVNPALLARRARLGRVRSTDPLTSDADITRRRWLPVDFDPVRPAGVSATEEEKAAAQERAERVIEYLTGKGWPAPVVADSGNGYHVLYRIDLPNDEASRDLVKGCLEALAGRFSDKAVSVDAKNFNAARIWKIYGTIARKGEDMPARPHRKARILSVPDPVDVVPPDLLEALAAEVKKPEKTSPKTEPAHRPRGKKRDFDLAAWLAEHAENLPCRLVPKNKPGHRYFYVLDPCPFSNGAHRDGAFLGQLTNGAVFTRCHHNSCGNRNRWREFRAMVEGGAPDQKSGKESHDPDVSEARDDDFARSLPFVEKDSRLYLDAIDGDGTFGFLSERDGKIVFEPTIHENGEIIRPATLPVHHNTGEIVFVVGVPRADLMQSAPVLPPDDLYARIDAHISKYCDVPDLERELFVYYILYSWFYTKSPTSPYLRFLGDTGKGKSRMAEVVSDLCFYPIRATGSSTVSGIMRFHEKWKGTLVIDESDLRGGPDDPLVKFLNVGFERGKYVIMSDVNDPNRQQIFHPYGPKVLAMREPFRDNATEGRCLSYSPYETHRKDIPPELSPVYHDEVADLRAIIARFVLRHWSVVDGDRMMDSGGLDIEPRLLQMARPVSVVLQLFPDGQARFIEYLRQRQQEIKRTRAASWEGIVFAATLDIARGEEGDPPEAVTARMVADALGTTPARVTRALGGVGFEVEPDNITFNSPDGTRRRKTVRKLVVPSPRVWSEIVRRYWYHDDDAPPPVCPDCLRGVKWIDPQRKLPHPLSQSVTTVTSVTPHPENETQTGSVTHVTHVTLPEGGRASQPPASREDLHDLTERYSLPPGWDVSGHIRFTKRGERCVCLGCGRPAMWQSLNPIRPLPLCDVHYAELSGVNAWKQPGETRSSRT